MTAYKIMVIEPDADFRESLRLLMNYSFEFHVTGLLKNVSAVRAKEPQPDIILADIEGKRDLKTLARQFPGVPVVVITADKNNDHIVELLSAGAVHYVCKSSEPAAYLAVLKEVLTGNIRIPDSVVKKLIRSKEAVEPMHSDMNPDLTPRENEMLSLLAKGHSYKTISEELFISVETVKRHCHNIYKKLGVKNRTEAINKNKAAAR